MDLNHWTWHWTVAIGMAIAIGIVGAWWAGKNDPARPGDPM